MQGEGGGELASEAFHSLLVLALLAEAEGDLVRSTLEDGFGSGGVQSQDFLCRSTISFHVLAGGRLAQVQGGAGG